MYRVDKIAWSGLCFSIESFFTFKDAKRFCDDHKDYSLVIIDELSNEKLYERIID